MSGRQAIAAIRHFIRRSSLSATLTAVYSLLMLVRVAALTFGLYGELHAAQRQAADGQWSYGVDPAGGVPVGQVYRGPLAGSAAAR